MSVSVVCIFPCCLHYSRAWKLGSIDADPPAAMRYTGMPTGSTHRSHAISRPGAEHSRFCPKFRLPTLRKNPRYFLLVFELVVTNGASWDCGWHGYQHSPIIFGSQWMRYAMIHNPEATTFYSNCFKLSFVPFLFEVWLTVEVGIISQFRPLFKHQSLHT
ncbi:hypothetical protein HAX54_034120 [Datura stramonium]|uniref:Secreted protein n=1 Tax=Datura stramonium TaxID=4076 RepID=A0ABS8VF05_DATST|nr:hypothetical protein [Datura stramonium]